MIPTLVGSGYSAVAAGTSHTVALKSDGSLWTWGSNVYGQLGHASTGACTLKSQPNCAILPVQVGSGYSAVAAGGNFTVALKSDGSLWAWGANSNGQLGYATTTTCGVNGLSFPCSTTPTLVGSGYSAVAAGGTNTVALKSDGSLWAWGEGDLVGDGTNIQRNSPIQIGSGYSAVAAGGGDLTMALKPDGSLWGWGGNGFGELGIGNTIPGYWAYNPVQIGSGYSAIAAGAEFGMALKPDGSLWTWGLNSSGQLGYATTTTCLVNPGANPLNIPCSMTPVQVGSGYRVGP
jgi:alpha-tubulin suppressor-like RCC1 family protein